MIVGKRMQQARFQDNVYIDVLLMSILHTEWQEIKD